VDASNPGKRVTPYELCETFTPAYQHLASHEKAVKGFMCAGIVPYDTSTSTILGAWHTPYNN